MWDYISPGLLTNARFPIEVERVILAFWDKYGTYIDQWYLTSRIHSEIVK